MPIVAQEKKGCLEISGNSYLNFFFFNIYTDKQHLPLYKIRDHELMLL